MKRALDHILEFQERVERLKGVQRKGWVKAGVRKPESVADHSYACAVLSMIAGDVLGLDTQRLIRMALLHDLSESIMGDLTPRQKSRLGAKFSTLEKRSAKVTLVHLPIKIKKRYLSLMDEYMNQRSMESRVLRDIDKIEMSIQALRYMREGHSARRMKKFLNSTEKDVRTDFGRALFEAVGSGK